MAPKKQTPIVKTNGGGDESLVTAEKWLENYSSPSTQKHQTNTNKQDSLSSQKEATNITKSTTQLTHKTTFLDTMLDWIRGQSISRSFQVTLSWCLAFVWMMYYRVFGVSSSFSKSNNDKFQPKLTPLMTESRDLYGRFSATDVYGELRLQLQLLSPKSKTSSWDDNHLVALIRSNETARRLMSRVMTTCLDASPETVPNYKHFRKLWPKFVELPNVNDVTTTSLATSSQQNLCRYTHALIVAIENKEQEAFVGQTVKQALDNCKDPTQVTVIVVINASETSSADELKARRFKTTHYWWGHFRIVPFQQAPNKRDVVADTKTLWNTGAICASQAQLLTFLLPDSLLPWRWDVHIESSLLGVASTPPMTAMRQQQQEQQQQQQQQQPHHACLFAVGCNVDGLSPKSPKYPAGMDALLWLHQTCAQKYGMTPFLHAGLRILAIRNQTFTYIGGFPNQPVMQTLEMIQLLERHGPHTVEYLTTPALCSLQRWQTNGTDGGSVLYMACVDALLEHRYLRQGWMPSEIAEYCRERSIVSSSLVGQKKEKKT